MFGPFYDCPPLISSLLEKCRACFFIFYSLACRVFTRQGAAGHHLSGTSSSSVLPPRSKNKAQQQHDYHRVPINKHQNNKGGGSTHNIEIPSIQTTSSSSSHSTEKTKLTIRKNDKSKSSNNSTTIAGVGNCGSGVSIGNDGLVTGSGIVISNVPLEQDKTYFEVHVDIPGDVYVGVSRYLEGEELNFPSELHLIGDRVKSWVAPFGNNGIAVEAGDVVSVLYDQSDIPTRLDFAINGVLLPHIAITGVRGQVWLIVGIQNEATVDLVFDANACQYLGQFSQRGFDSLMMSRSIL